MNDYKIRLVDGDFVEINSADYTDLVDVNFEISLGEYGVARNPRTGETIIGAVPGDGVIAAYEIRTISLDDVKDALDNIDQGFYDFSDVTPAEYDSALTEDHLAQAILDINSYSGDFTPFVTHDMVSNDMQDAGLIAIEDEEPVAESKINEEMYDELGNAITPEEYAKGVANGTVNEAKEADEHEANELVLYMENTQRHYNNIMAVVKNLARKMARGNFDKELAVKGMMYPVNDGARAYKKEFSGEGYEKYAFNPATRELAARELLDRYMEDIENEAKAKSESKINEADEQFTLDAEGALADFLGTNIENVTAMNYDHYGIPMFEADGEEWAVTDDYDLVEESAKEEVIQLIDEMGVEALNWDNMGGIGEYLNMDWFDEAMEESNQFYIDDIREESASSDEYENRLAEEMAEAGVETEEDYLEVLNNNYNSGYDWYVDNFGQPDGDVIAKAGLDSEKAAEEVLATDGAGHLLSGYDGDMVEHEFEGTTFYMFRQS